MIKLERTEKMDRLFEKAIAEVEMLVERKSRYDGAAKGAVVSLGAYARVLSAEVHLAALEIMYEKQKALPLIRQVMRLEGKKKK